MKLKAAILAISASTLLSGCVITPEMLFSGQDIVNDAAYDQGNMMQPGHSMAEMIAGVWVDGNGCEHWIIDDGIEGYMSTRWGSDGKPYCPAGNMPYTTKGFNRTVLFEDSTDANGVRNVPGEFTTVPGKRGINTGSQSPTNISGAIPFQSYQSGATIADTNLIGGYFGF